MTKKTGWFLAGIAAALAILMLAVTLSGRPMGDSAPSAAANAPPAPEYTADEVANHFEKLAAGSATATPETPQPQAPAADVAKTLPSQPEAAKTARPEPEQPQAAATDKAKTRLLQPLRTLPRPPAQVSGDLELSTATGVISEGAPATVILPQSGAGGGGIAAGGLSIPQTVADPKPAIPSATPEPEPEPEPDPGIAFAEPTDPEPEPQSVETPLPVTTLPATPQTPPQPAAKTRGIELPTTPPRADAKTETGVLARTSVVPKSSGRGVQGATAGSNGFQRPQFPWPPPQASTVVRLPLSRFEALTPDGTHGDVADLLERALDDGEYFDRSYWVAPGGFALVTRLERITEEGISVESRKRWPTGNLRERFDLSSYLRALFYTDPGYFRVIVFLLSTEFERTTDQEPTPAEAFRWLRRGMVMLPREMAEQSITPRHELTALIYEFERVPGSDAVVLAPGRLTGRTHLAQARLNRLLSAE
ncbi:MAG: hypothetical protein AAGD13_16005 [Pseudomonadota bacterium]